jgi:hypothetical protein
MSTAISDLQGDGIEEVRHQAAERRSLITVRTVDGIVRELENVEWWPVAVELGVVQVADRLRGLRAGILSQLRATRPLSRILPGAVR